MSTAPKRSSTASRNTATCAASRTSQGMASTFRPSASSSVRTCSSGSGRRPQIATLAPVRASSRAVARPMPVPPPVTMATAPALASAFSGERNPSSIAAVWRSGDLGCRRCAPRGRPAASGRTNLARRRRLGDAMFVFILILLLLAADLRRAGRGVEGGCRADPVGVPRRRRVGGGRVVGPQAEGPADPARLRRAAHPGLVQVHGNDACSWRTKPTPVSSPLATTGTELQPALRRDARATNRSRQACGAAPTVASNQPRGRPASARRSPRSSAHAAALIAG